MSVYIVGQIDITDPDRYAGYEAGFLPVFTEYDGEIVAVDDQAEVIEGEPTFTRCVILRFPDRDAFTAWYRSDAYQALAVDRWGASDSSIVMVEAFS